MGVLGNPPIIADRVEFADALDRLRRGYYLVRTGQGSCNCTIDGGFVHHSFDVLLHYGLIAKFDNLHGFPGIQYYRITPEGRSFAERVCADMQARRPLERLLMRLTG